MSAARAGQWDLLGFDSDPVPADGSELTGLIRHYKNIADAMTAQAALLKKVGEGDENLLKGESADAIRERAGKTHENLGKAGARYQDVHDALKTYQPELQTARSETGKALAAAEKAAGDKRGAEGMPDPANESRSDDDPPLSDDDRQASRDRTNRIAEADGDLAAAQTKAANAMAALDAAAEAAVTKIKENWKTDDLHHSWQEAAYHGFMKFLKGLVEVLGWIGMALAIVAMVIPGLQWLGTAALVVGLVALGGSVVLAATGEESWMGVVWGALGVLTAFGGKWASKLIEKATKGLKEVANVAKVTKIGQIGELTKQGSLLTKLGQLSVKPFRITTGMVDDAAKANSIKIAEALNSVKGLDNALKINPAAWKVWEFSAAVGLGGTKKFKEISAAIDNLGLPMIHSVIPKRIYALGSGMWFVGFASGAWSTGVPGTSFDGEDLRNNFDGTKPFEEEHMTTPYKGPEGLE